MNLRKFIEQHWSRLSLFTGLILMMLIGWIAYASGNQVRLTFFYIFPILLMSWYSSLGGALIVIVFSVLLWYFIGQIDQPPDHNSALLAWNTFMKIGFTSALAIIVSRLKIWLETERNLARRDPLTGLTNRRGFFEIAEMLLSQARRHARPVAILYFDVDNFKKVNDSQGHAVGDQLLRRVGKTLLAQTRVSDLSARMGGDEFILLMPETDSGMALAIYSRILEALNLDAQIKPRKVTYSAGLVTFMDIPTKLDTVLKIVDELMYEVKNNSKNGVRQALWQKKGLVSL